MSKLAAILLLILTQGGSGHFIDVGWNDTQCVGAVTIYEGSNETVVTESSDVKATLDLVMMEGCGCFTIHSKRGGRGKSFFMGRNGNYSLDDIGWSKVRSVQSVPCDRMAMPGWVVIIIVVGIITMVTAALLGAFKYRNYRRNNNNNNT